MDIINLRLTGLIVSIIIIIITTLMFIKIKKTNKFRKLFIALNCSLFIHTIALILQILCRNLSIPPIYFEYLTYLGGSFTPLIFLLIALRYKNQNIDIYKMKNIFLIPITFILVLWTNDLHHLFYEQYSVNFAETIYGPFVILFAIYSYISIVIAAYLFIKVSIVRTGYNLMHTNLIVIGIILPVVINMLGFLRIVQISIYLTPMIFIITVLFLAIAIFKYRALSINPVALRTVIDTISESFVIISDNGDVIDSNIAFKNDIKKIFNVSKIDNLFEFMNKQKIEEMENLNSYIKETRKNNSVLSKELLLSVKNVKVYYEVEVKPIKEKYGKEYIATLLLFKNITQHKINIKEIKDKQDVIVKQGQLVSIGELAGGMAHDINTPISAIKTVISMLKDYPARDDMEKEMLDRADKCTEKVINIVNSVRNQIRNLGSDTKEKINIKQVLEEIKIITSNEAMKRKCTVILKDVEDIEIYGSKTKLSQVLTNLIVNAIQAYNEEAGTVEISVKKIKGKVLIKVKDYVKGGIPERMRESLGNAILTTKGTNGTGLGVYLAFSIIKGDFNGKIDFVTGENGSTFSIYLDEK